MIRLVIAALSGFVGLILVLPVLVLAFPFVAMAYWIRLVADVTEPSVAGKEADEKLIRFDPELGWRPCANLDTHYLPRRDDIHPIRTDEEGWPGHLSVEESEIVVVGDSFAYGYGARPGEAFWEQAPDLRIKPIGCPGWDMVQEMEAMRSLGDRLSGKLVIWFIYLENDIPDTLRPHWRGYRKPFPRISPETGGWEVVSDHIREEKWRHSKLEDNVKAFSEVCGPGPLSDRNYAACGFIIEEAAEICRGVGAELIVTSIPFLKQLDPEGRLQLASLRRHGESFDADYPDRQLQEICARLGLPFIPMKRFLGTEDYKPLEKIHWNVRGHRKVANLLRREHAERRAGSPSQRRTVDPTPNFVTGS